MPAMMRIGQFVLTFYKIVDILPAGGQAMLAKAIDTRTRQMVVIKQLSRWTSTFPRRRGQQATRQAGTNSGLALKLPGAS